MHVPISKTFAEVNNLDASYVVIWAGFEAMNVYFCSMLIEIISKCAVFKKRLHPQMSERCFRSEK